MSSRTRRRFSAQKKAQIVRRHLGDKVAVSDLADDISTVVKQTETKAPGAVDLELVGGTRDPDVVRIVREYIDALNDGTFRDALDGGTFTERRL